MRIRRGNVSTENMRRDEYALITGASSGLGREFAVRLAKEGYDLILTARRTARLEKLKQDISKTINSDLCIEVITADLSNMAECRRLMSLAENKNIKVLINNAGFGDCGSFLEGDTEKELSMIDVNVKAVHLLTKLMLIKMKENDSGYILNVASSAGLMPAGPYMASYYATKAYVTSLTRAIAEELREQNSHIYVGCLCPGPVNTEFNDIANVRFALKGISTEYCVDYAVDMMKKKKEVIIPTFQMKCAMLFGRYLPQRTYIRICAHQQKKKFDQAK